MNLGNWFSTRTGVGNVVLTNNSNAQLRPVAHNMSGRLLPVCSGPVVCCPLSILVLTNVHRVLVVAAPRSGNCFRHLLNSNDRFNVRLRCTRRPDPSNLTRTFVVNRAFLGNRPSYLILNSGVFFNRNFDPGLHRITTHARNTAMFNCRIVSPRHFNIIRFSSGFHTVSLRRGPGRPGSG